MTLRIDQGERDAPRAPDHDPSVDAEVQAQPFHVSHEMNSGVGRQVSAGVAGQGPATAAASLIEDDRPVAGGIEVPPAAGRGRGARAAVQPDRRETVGRADDLPVHGMTVAHLEVAGVVWLDGRIHDSILPGKAVSPPLPSERWSERAVLPDYIA